jgi:hypothetical protein
MIGLLLLACSLFQPTLVFVKNMLPYVGLYQIVHGFSVLTPTDSMVDKLSNNTSIISRNIVLFHRLSYFTNTDRGFLARHSTILELVVCTRALGLNNNLTPIMKLITRIFAVRAGFHELVHWENYRSTHEGT